VTQFRLASEEMRMITLSTVLLCGNGPFVAASVGRHTATTIANIKPPQVEGPLKGFEAVGIKELRHDFILETSLVVNLESPAFTVPAHDIREATVMAVFQDSVELPRKLYGSRTASGARETRRDREIFVWHDTTGSDGCGSAGSGSFENGRFLGWFLADNRHEISCVCYSA
jgi:hypothetical protein